MPILLMTGRPQWLQDPINGYMVLRKPFFRQTLLEAVWKVVTTAAIEGNSPDNSPGSRSNISISELQAHWQTEAQRAKKRYDECSLHLSKLLAEYKQRLTPTPDGDFAVRKALIQQSAARQEHMRVLRILTDIITSD